MRPALILLLLAGPAVARQSLPADGSELFRGLLPRLGYTPAADASQARVVIVFGPPGPSGIPATCQRVLTAGGSVLIVAADFPTLPDYLPGRPTVSAFKGGRQRLVVRQMVTPPGRRVGVCVEATAPNGQGPAVPGGVAVELPPARLAWGRPARPWVGTDVGFGPDGSLAAISLTRQAGGRALVVASAEVFSNQLMAGQFDADTGNLDFAFNVLRWLKPAGSGPVPCLFLDHGEVVDRFDAVNYTAAATADLPPVGPPPLSAFLTPEAQAKLTDAANEALDRVQQNDSLSGPFAGPRRFQRTMRWLLGVLALIMAVALIRRARAARRPGAEPPSKAAAGPTGTLARRREELLRGGDHTAAVRDYLIELFREYGLRLDEYRHPKGMPRVEADRPTTDQLAKLWQAAYGPHPVSYTRWKELEPMIEEVRAAGAAGRWRFAGGRA